MSDRDWDSFGATDRTALAWQRTALATIGVAVLAVRAGIVDHVLGLALPVAALLTIAAGAEWLLAARLTHERRGAVQPRIPLHARALLGIATVTCISAAGSIAIALAA